MVIRWVTSVNWLLATLAIGAAVIYPMYREARLQSIRTSVEAASEVLVKGQKDHHEAWSRFIYFRGNEIEVLNTALKSLKQEPVAVNAVDGFQFEAVPDQTDAHALIIRAFPTQKAIQDGAYPPMLYEYRVSLDGPNPVAQKNWRVLGRVAGLLSAFDR